MVDVGDKVTGPWKGAWPLAAGRVYPSGGVHNAWDVACPIGTPLYAARDGKVGARNAGVPNNRPGVNPGAGAPSNFVVLWVLDDQGDRAYLYYQHMSPDHVIGKGKTVQAGDLVGYSGNSGNASGPHLHIAGGLGWPTEPERYAYLTDTGRLIYPPSELFTEDDVAAKDVWDYKLPNEVTENTTPAGVMLTKTHRRVNDLVKLVAAQQGGDQAAIEAALRAVLGSLDD